MENGGRQFSFHDSCGERTNMSGIKIKRTLNESAERKMIILEAEVENSADPAVVILEKLPFTEETARGVASESTQLENEMQNDVYGQYRLQPHPANNPVKANIIHPATQKHIEKYTSSAAHLVAETPDLYYGVTLPFLQNEQFSLGWVYNFLEHKSEQERVIYENPDPNLGFMMAPDLKWTGKQIEDLYCLAIVHKKDIKSLRDLTQAHLPLLHGLLKEGKNAIKEKYGLPSSKIRAYIHYQPSYYHLHVHYTNIEYAAPGVNCEKSHMLETVISNIESNGSYYKEATLNFVVREKDKLFRAYSDFGYFKDDPEVELNVLKDEFESGDCSKILKFLEMLGRAKHEPSGEFWETSFGESAWRMAVMSMCLPQHVNRRKLVELSLVSSLSSLGVSNDENTVWESKIKEISTILRNHLPALIAGRLEALFHEHVEVRRGRLSGSTEHTLYRGILELEEILLRWEEDCKGNAKPTCYEPIIQRMASLQFPGHTRYKHFKDKGLLEKGLKFILEVSKLMRLKRTGWVNSQVRDPETVAGHMYRMGFLGLMFSHTERKSRSRSSPQLYADACIIGICHDMAECIIGDITPHCKISKEEKARKELLAFSELVQDLPESTAMDFFTPFTRFENQEPEDLNAILTKDFDRLDMILQAFEYEKKEKRGKFLQQFFDSTMDYFKTEAVKKWQKCILQIRDEHFK